MDPAITIPEPPTPRDPRTLARWQHTRLRRRLLYGGWEGDLVRRLEREIGTTRRTAWGIPDLSSNVFRSSMGQLAVLYDREPTARAPAGGDDLLAEVERAGWWQLAQRVQRDTLGLREMLVHVDVVDGEDGPELQYRPVYPDLVEAVAAPERPEEPVHLWEAVQRTIGGELVWTWDEWDIRDPERPAFRVWSESRREPASDELGLGGLEGDGYTWRTEDGRPILPFVTYHAARTGQLFDAFEASEMVEGVLNVGVLKTEWKHGMKHCNYLQRFVVGARLRGVQVSDDDDGPASRREHIADPAVVLEFELEEGSTAAQIGAFPQPQDPGAILEAISQYERALAAMGGISPADIMRVAGDPRSGYALAISTEGQRAAARRFEPLFRRSDERLLRISALLWAQRTGQQVPTAGYRVAYAAIPPSPEERASELDHLLAQMDRGLMSRVEVYQRLNVGATAEDARVALAEIARINGAQPPTTAAA